MRTSAPLIAVLCAVALSGCLEGFLNGPWPWNPQPVTDGGVPDPDPDPDPVFEPGGNDLGLIYFRIQQDLTVPPGGSDQWCDLPSGNYRDDNPDMPALIPNAHMDDYAGPMEPGQYSGQFSFWSGDPSPDTMLFHYTLERPARGYRRFYTQVIRDHTELGRCVVTAVSPEYLTWYDERITDGVDGGAVDAGQPDAPAYVQFYIDPAEYSRDAGYEVWVEVEGRTFVPQHSIGGCEQQLTFQGTVMPEVSPSPRILVDIYARNYGCLDTAFGAPYCEEEGHGAIYVHDLRPGCNTIEIGWGSSQPFTAWLRP